MDTHYYSSRAFGQRVSVDFVIQALIRVLLGPLKASVELNNQLIEFNARSPSSLPVITVSAPGREQNSIFAKASRAAFR